MRRAHRRSAGTGAWQAGRNEQALLAAAVFVASGVDARTREIAARAGVGIGTVHRHFPTRADLVVAVHRHQVEACADAGPALLAAGDSPAWALGGWVDPFVDFLLTEHGLAAALRSDSAGFDALHAYSLDRLGTRVRSCSTLRWTPVRSVRGRTPTS